ncbi:hypothetical protein M2273_005444 [Mucilaginibacter lappiensis]|jgi:hypothetical protein
MLNPKKISNLIGANNYNMSLRDRSNVLEKYLDLVLFRILPVINKSDQFNGLTFRLYSVNQ